MGVAATALAKIGESFAHARCVVLVTVNQDMYNVEQPSIDTNAAALNSQIRSVAKAHAWVVADWAGLVSRYLAGGEKQGSLTIDTVHPTQLGRDKLAALYADALSRCG